MLTTINSMDWLHSPSPPRDRFSWLANSGETLKSLLGRAPLGPTANSQEVGPRTWFTPRAFAILPSATTS